MTANAKKYLFLVSKKQTSTVNSNNIKIDITGVKIARSSEHTFLDVFIDDQLTLKSHNATC